MKHKIATLLFVISTLSASAQVLTLSDALKIVLENNYDLKIAKEDIDIAKLNAARGNAGMLPTVGVSGSLGLASNNTKQEFSNGTVVDKNAASTQTSAVGAGMSWTLFDGMKMFATYDRLQEEKGRSELALRLQIENTVAQLINTYSGIVKQKQLLIAADTALQLYEERMHISKSRWDLGAGSKIEYLQAKVDMNAQKTMHLQQRNKLESLKIDLNELLSRPSLTVFDVVDSLQVNYHPSLDDMKTEAMKKNTSILLGASQQRSMALMLKEVSAARYPRVNWNAGYNYNNTDNQAGFILQNRNLGWSTGLTASWTIYNGHQVSRQIEGSKIRLQQSQYTLDKTTQQVDAAVVKAYVFFTNALAVLDQEQENQALAAEVIQVSMERYRLGNASNLELKDAQRSFEEAQSRLVSARYDAKLAETELLRLNGMLVK